MRKTPFTVVGKVAATGAAFALIPWLAGCPSAFPLIATATTTPGTVDKPLVLRGSATGGTAPYTFAWAQVSGPSASVADASAAVTQFTPNAAGIYVFELTVTDSGGGVAQQVAVATVETAVGHIQFFVNEAFSILGTIDVDVIKVGNPATLIVDQTIGAGERGDGVEFIARASVMDPQFTSDQVTDMHVTYQLVTVPGGAREEDISIDKMFDSISNQGTGDVDRAGFAGSTLDSEVDIQIRANSEGTFQTLSNLATLIDNFGGLVAGDYIFRVTATNPRGFQRSRDLTVTLVLEGIEGLFGGRSAGPRTIAVKQLPAGSPGRVTNKVMMGDDTSTMVVTVLPSSPTTYRFYLREANPIPGLGGTSGTIAHPEFVSASATTVSTIGATTDITLTIGSAGGMPTGLYDLYVESFDSLGNVFETQVTVNGATPVRFHVTNDFFAQSSVNAAMVGQVSNLVDAPQPFQGWSAVQGGYGALNALADVNLDGAPDIVTAIGNGFAMNTAGFVDGSASALRHPVNSGNFRASDDLAPTNLAGVANVGGAITQIAVGDLNGDSLPDVAARYVDGGAGVVRIFFHTGDRATPYSSATQHTLLINAPEYLGRFYRNEDGQLSQDPAGDFGFPVSAGAPPTRAEFGTRIAVGDVDGDDQADLIVTDPAFSRVTPYNVTTSGTTTPDSLSTFFDGSEGRVYVFRGGSTGNLLPGRPAIVSSRLSEEASLNTTLAVGQQAVSATVTETLVQYTAQFTGGLFDQIGQSLAVATTFATGSPEAVGDLTTSRQVLSLRVPNVTAGGATYAIADGETIAILAAGQARTYEFDTDAVVGAGNVAVDISGAVANQQPANARTALVAAINGDADRLADAAVNGVLPDTIDLTAIAAFSVTDVVARGAAASVAVVGAGLGNVLKVRQDGTTVILGLDSDFDINNDGVVYRQGAISGTTGTLTGAIRGTTNSNMGLGATLAKGDINNAGGNDDLAIGALDNGSPAGRNDGVAFAGEGIDNDDDGGVVIVLDGATTFNLVSTAGSSTLGAPAGITPSGLGRHIGLGDVNADGRADLLYSEPGFGRIFLHNGNNLSATPNSSFVGGVLNTALANALGSFLFGDVTGDTRNDWLILDGAIVFGFAGFER